MVRTLLTLAVGFVLGIWFGSLVDLERFGLPNTYTTEGVLESPLVTTAKKILRIDDSEDSEPAEKDTPTTSQVDHVDVSRVILKGDESILYVHSDAPSCDDRGTCMYLVKLDKDDPYRSEEQNFTNFDHESGHEYVLIVAEAGEGTEVRSIVAKVKVD